MLALPPSLPYALVAALRAIRICTTFRLHTLTKGDAHALDDLCDLVGVVARGTRHCLYFGRLDPSSARDRRRGPCGSSHAGPAPAGVVSPLAQEKGRSPELRPHECNDHRE